MTDGLFLVRVKRRQHRVDVYECNALITLTKCTIGTHHRMDPEDFFLVCSTVFLKKCYMHTEVESERAWEFRNVKFWVENHSKMLFIYY